MTQETNDILQLAAVALILAICVAYIIRSVIRRRKASKTCGGCPIAGSCRSRSPHRGNGNSCCG